jgi:hypothetical protein
MMLSMCMQTCIGEPKREILPGIAKRRREDNRNGMECENLEWTEWSVEFAGRWSVSLRCGGRGRHHFHIELQEHLSFYDTWRTLFFRNKLFYYCFQITEGNLRIFTHYKFACRRIYSKITASGLYQGMDGRMDSRKNTYVLVCLLSTFSNLCLFPHRWHITGATSVVLCAVVPCSLVQW